MNIQMTIPQYKIFAVVCLIVAAVVSGFVGYHLGQTNLNIKESTNLSQRDAQEGQPVILLARLSKDYQIGFDVVSDSIRARPIVGIAMEHIPAGKVGRILWETQR